MNYEIHVCNHKTSLYFKYQHYQNKLNLCCPNKLYFFMSALCISLKIPFRVYKNIHVRCTMIFSTYMEKC